MLLLRSVYTEPRPFPLLTLLMRRLGMHKKLEERTKRPPPKGYSIVYGIRSAEKKERRMFKVKAFVFPSHLHV